MKAFIFDTETTGLVKNCLIPLASQPRVIEFFGHTVDDETGEVLQEIEFMCKPGEAFDLEKIKQGEKKSIAQITGIKNEDVANAQLFSHHAPQVHAAIACSDAVVAHNLSFDKALIEAEFARCDKLPHWPQRQICTVEETEWIKGHRLSLTDLHMELFGEPFKDAHRARFDVQALTRCYLELRKRGDL